MRTQFLILILLLQFGLLKAQNLLTVFIDTLHITVNNKNIYSSNKSMLKFFPNNENIKLTFFDDGIHKLETSLQLSNSFWIKNLTVSGPRFYINDSSIALTQSINSDFEQCRETYSENLLLQTRDYDKPDGSLKILIKLCYRIMNFAPIDTTNYRYNYKQGVWIGSHDDAKKVIVRFHHDKREGTAQALYSDGSSYNVFFMNDMAENFGQGYWKNVDQQNRFKFSYKIPNILGDCYSLNSNFYPAFNFNRASKSKMVNGHHDLSVHFETKAIHNDSLQYRVRGDFMAVLNDSMVIRSEELEIHDFYKKRSDSLHYIYQNVPSGFVKVPLKDISKIYYERSEWKTFTLRTTLVSFATALIISPLISIQKGGFNSDRFKKVTLSSIGVAVLSISFGIAYSQKEYLIKPTKRSNKIWTIEPTYY